MSSTRTVSSPVFGQLQQPSIPDRPTNTGECAVTITGLNDEIRAPQPSVELDPADGDDEPTWPVEDGDTTPMPPEEAQKLFASRR